MITFPDKQVSFFVQAKPSDHEQRSSVRQAFYPTPDVGNAKEHTGFDVCIEKFVLQHVRWVHEDSSISRIFRVVI
jgi:hypothetical protein